MEEEKELEERPPKSLALAGSAQKSNVAPHCIGHNTTLNGG